MLAIAWEYLTERYRAARFTDRTSPEWPPHPDRVFQALVATWGERGEDPDEKAALDWLEDQGTPELAFPDVAADTFEPVKAFVPVNDAEPSTAARKRARYTDAMLALLPQHRNRKPRFFPSVWVGDGTFALIWPHAEPRDYREQLETLCREVVRIGHSSSFVRCWLEDNPVTPKLRPAGDRRVLGTRLRIPFNGRRAGLAKNYADQKSRGSYEGTSRALEWPYVQAVRSAGEHRSLFSPQLIVLRIKGPNRWSLHDTLAVTDTLRRTLIPMAERHAPQAMELISGHHPNGARSSRPHIAYFPLAFVGSRYADGHLMGVGIAVPRNATADDQDAVFRAIAHAADQHGRISLHLTSTRSVQLEMAMDVPFQETLRSETWSGPSQWWASVTPIVMDRMYRRRDGDHSTWLTEQIAVMCRRVELPDPVELQVRPVSFHRGAPAVRGMQPLPRKDGAARQMVHALIKFPSMTHGPILLGAGRFRGYGLFRPWRKREQGNASII